MSIEVIKPGPLSSLQDMGRAGWQRFGVIASGVMDEWSHRVANLLVGNFASAGAELADTATIEITLMGPSLLFHTQALIAIVGGDLSPRIGERPVPMAQPVLVRAGSRLDFGRRVFGCRAYLAVHGGYEVAPVMGSASTYLRAGFGGFEGRALRKGDRLPIGAGDVAGVYPTLAGLLRQGDAEFAVLPEGVLPPPEHPARLAQKVRVVQGQQWSRFTPQAQAHFDTAEFVVNLNSDRMGYRLDGPGLSLVVPLEMISEAVAFGTVQVPPDGNPIVLMADRQTTGGYPKIASVASIDLPVLAQRVPGEALRFERITLAAAQHLYLEREQAFARFRDAIELLKGNR